MVEEEVRRGRTEVGGGRMRGENWRKGWREGWRVEGRMEVGRGRDEGWWRKEKEREME